MQITRILQIYEKDWKKLVYLSVLNFIMMFGNTIGLSIANSLLLKKVGINSLPAMYVINSLGIIFISLFYFPFLTKFKQTSILKNIFFAFSFAIIIARLSIPFRLNWIYILLYLAATLFGWVYYTQFWTLATNMCNIREGKRMFSLVVSAGLLGGGVGGFVTRATVNAIHSNNLLFVWSFSLFAIAIVISYFEKIMIALPEKKETETQEKESWGHSLKRILTPLQKIPLLKTIGLTFFVYAIVVHILDFQFNFILDKTFLAEDKLTGFYGNYYGYFYAATFIIVLVAVSRLLRALGVGNIVMSLPLAVGLGFVILSFNFRFIPIVIIKFFRDVIGNSVIESTYPLLFLPIAEKFRRQALIFNESFAIPFGILIAGVTIRGLGGYLGPLGLSVLGVILSGVWIYFSFQLRNQYLKTFIQAIENKSYFEKEEPLYDITHLGRGRTFETLKGALYDENEKVSMFAMELLAKSTDKQASEILLEFLKDKNTDIRRKATVLLTLGGTKDFTMAFDLMPFLKDSDPRIRANAIESLGKLDPIMAKDAATDLLSDEHPRVRTNAAIIMWKYGEREKGLRVLTEMLKDTQPENRVRTIYALSELGGSDILPLIKQMVDDPDDEVRLYVVKALENAGNEESISLLIKMLGDKTRKVRRAASQVLEKMNDKASELLLKAMSTEGGLSQKEIIFIMIKRKNSEYFPIIMDYCDQEIKLIYETIFKIDELEKSGLVESADDSAKEMFKIIVDSFNIRNERKLFKVLRILGAMQDSQAFMLAVRRLRDYYNPEAQANAVEVIESVVGVRFVKILLPLLEDMTLRERALEAQKHWNFQSINAKEFLKEMNVQEEFKGLHLCAKYLMEKLRMVSA